MVAAGIGSILVVASCYFDLCMGLTLVGKTLDLEQKARFDELMGHSRKKVFNLAYRLSGNRTDAEDIAQEAYFRAFRGFESYEGDRPFENWIFRIVTRLYLDLRRQRKRRVLTVSYDAPLQPDGSSDTVFFEKADDAKNPEDVLLGKSMSEELEMSLERLTPEQRKLVWMADVEGIPYKEIAERIDAPVGTVRSRLHRAHKQIKTFLESSGKKSNMCPTG